jgi:hypothetical protein
MQFDDQSSPEIWASFASLRKSPVASPSPLPWLPSFEDPFPKPAVLKAWVDHTQMIGSNDARIDPLGLPNICTEWSSESHVCLDAAPAAILREPIVNGIDHSYSSCPTLFDGGVRKGDMLRMPEVLPALDDSPWATTSKGHICDRSAHGAHLAISSSILTWRAGDLCRTLDDLPSTLIDEGIVGIGGGCCSPMGLFVNRTGGVISFDFFASIAARVFEPTLEPDVHGEAFATACGPSTSAIITSTTVLKLSTLSSKSVDGVGPSPGTVTTPVLHPIRDLPISEMFRVICCGKDHVCALTDFCQLYAWGDAMYGALGHGDASVGERIDSPTLVKALLGQPVSAIACGARHTVCIAYTGLFSWGWGASGQLGLGHSSNMYTPQKVKALSDKVATSAACGYNFTLVSTIAGEVFAFGGGDMGQLGTGHNRDSALPLAVPRLCELGVQQVVAGTTFGAALSDAGHLFVWGGGSSTSPVMLGRPGQLQEYVGTTLSASAFHVAVLCANISSDNASVVAALQQRNQLMRSWVCTERKYCRQLQNMVSSYLRPLLDAAAGVVLEQIGGVLTPSFLRSQKEVVQSSLDICQVLCEDILHPTAKSLAESIDRLLAFPSYNPSRLLRRLEAAIASIREYGLLLPAVKWELEICAQQDSAVASHIFSRRSDCKTMHLDPSGCSSESIPMPLGDAADIADSLHDNSHDRPAEIESQLTPTSCCTSAAAAFGASRGPKVGESGVLSIRRPNMPPMDHAAIHAAEELTKIGDAIARKLQSFSAEPIELAPLLGIAEREMQSFVPDKSDKQSIKCSSANGCSAPGGSASGGEREKLRCWINGQLDEPLKQLAFYSKMLQDWSVLLDEARTFGVGNDWGEQEGSVVRSLYSLTQQVLHATFVSLALHEP